MALTRTTNQRLEFVRKERQKREKIVEKQKTEAMAAKRWRIERGISLSNKKEKNYESDTGDKTNLDQADNGKSSLLFWEGRVGGSYKQLKLFIPYKLW